LKTFLVNLSVLCSFLALPSQGLSQEAPEKPIWDAASDGDIEAIEAHIAAETDLNEQNETGYAPLHYGVMKTRPGVVALLLEAGADPDVINNQDKTPLDLAISGSKDEIIDLLLEAGAAQTGDLSLRRGIKAVEEDSKASVLADVGQDANVNAAPLHRWGEEDQWIGAGGEVENAKHPDEDGAPPGDGAWKTHLPLSTVHYRCYPVPGERFSRAMA